jgi:threonyl-tRNA synthetase
MAHAVKILFPDAKLGIGPSIEDGFYYDFDSPIPIKEEDLPRIEEKMKEIIKANYPFIKEDVPKEKAIEIFKNLNEPYKVLLLNEINDDVVTLYRHDDFVDLCKGPHLKSTGEIKSFKLLSIAGAYWRGNEKNPMMQRIYGTAFFSEEELNQYLHKLEEIKKRDHRKIGKDLSLFSIHPEIGAGLVHWHPKGAIIKRIIEELWYEEHLNNGYELVSTPHIASEEIYKISGHLENYADLMYSSMDIEGMPFRIKPMNCPGHIMIYKTRIRSYKELPIRFAEMGTVYRYEKSGVLHGLLRVRGFTIDDAHIFCREDQVEEEIIKVFNFAIDFLKKFGFTEFNIYIATMPEKAIGTKEQWEIGINALKNAVNKLGFKYHIDEKGGAFYGPKIDLKVKDAISREWQCSTIQFDFNLPQRFEIKYVGEDGKFHTPIMIHRAILGSLERFIGILIEHYGGAFPLWLSPIQVVIIPINETHYNYAKNVYQDLKKNKIRVEIDNRNATINYRIRDNEMNKICYIIIIGDKEVASNTISVRERKKGNIGSMKLEEFIERVKYESKI